MVPPPGDDPLALTLSGGRRVPAGDLTWREATSGGPGGQHANRTASRVELRVSIEVLPLTAVERTRLYERLAPRIVGAGELVVRCGDHREQHRNRRVAARRLERLINDAIKPVTPRIRTRPGAGVRMRMREQKQHESKRKARRRWRWDEDDA